ncbi:hypothetical protein [Phormidium sp. CCY1219]|jgi:hypothetical protein|uniref:hypothetical protein n=1 Tax=Phormidium sp. CCY1219 TaxID=2886104 RepID=UPI002D1F101B|nr:hypothetical protein [Phormidium sp. CCY1219]MEB3831510.1 hypothetical protein [Phormidium sp. CCY1219]
MSEETPKKPQQPAENTENKTAKQDAVDPRNLVMKGGYQKDPRELVNDPGVTPEMLNEPGDLREDLMR